MRIGNKMVDIVFHKGKIYCFVRDLTEIDPNIKDYSEIIPMLLKKHEPLFIIESVDEATKFLINYVKRYTEMQGWERHKRLVKTVNGAGITIKKLKNTSKMAEILEEAKRLREKNEA